MKFAWKVTLAALCILLLSTGVGSYLLISLSFQSALEREIDMAQEEMQMLRVSYEAVCDARGITLENVAERGRSLERTLKEAAYFSDRQFRITTPTGSHIYSTLDSASDQELLSQIGRRSSGYVLRHEEKTGRYLLHCAGPVALPDGILYMETIRDISRLFSDREIHYQVYRWIILLVVGVSSLVMFALSYWLTTPIRSLGRVATQLAQGDYTPRAKVSGDDEIGELAVSFNRMADAIARNVQELEAALRAGWVDLAVHSCKDLPMDLPEDLPLAAFSRREDPRDVLVLPRGAAEPDMRLPIGSSSARRRASSRTSSRSRGATKHPFPGTVVRKPSRSSSS